MRGRIMALLGALVLSGVVIGVVASGFGSARAQSATSQLQVFASMGVVGFYDPGTRLLYLQRELQKRQAGDIRRWEVEIFEVKDPAMSLGDQHYRPK